MKLISEQELEKLANNHVKSSQFGGEVGRYEFDASDLREIQKHSYNEGFTMAVAKLKALCLEFAGYYYCNCDNNCEGEKEYWFNEFLKEKIDKTK